MIWSKITGIVLCAACFLLLQTQQIFAQTTTQQNQSFYRARVVKILNQGEKVSGTTTAKFQDVQLQLLDGNDKGKLITVENGGQTNLTSAQMVAPGDTVIVTQTGNSKQYTIYDKYRVTPIIILAVLFAIVVLLIAQVKGLGSLLGLGISFAVIIFYIIPQILGGADPVQTSIIGSLAILLVTTYLAHGFSKQTTVALISTFFSLMATVFIASAAIDFTHLSGMSEEVATTLQGPASTINAQGLLLGGIIIGTLGALNDITTTQSAAIFELLKANPLLTFKDLLLRGFLIGREHIVSMVNTLVLAYAGSSLALLLFLHLNPSNLPFWIMINTEDIGDEIIRTIAGSFGLILVVPIVTIIAAMAAVYFKPKLDR